MKKSNVNKIESKTPLWTNPVTNLLLIKGSITVALTSCLTALIQLLCFAHVDIINRFTCCVVSNAVK